MVLEKVEKIVADEAGVSKDNINLDTRFKNLGIDSLQIFEIIMAVEDEFHMEIPNEDVESMESVEDVVKYVNERLH